MSQNETILLIKNTVHEYETIRKADGFKNSEEYIAISEPLEVFFTMLSDEAVVNSEVESLKTLKETILSEAQVTVNRIEEKIQSLLSITHQPAKD